nr:hypothetical protein [Tanacetum cinerariifolium]
LDPLLQIDDLLKNLDEKNGFSNSPENAASGGAREGFGGRSKVSGNGSGRVKCLGNRSSLGTNERITIVWEIRRKRDYYDILGVSKDCGIADIRKAYLKLSLKNGFSYEGDVDAEEVCRNFFFGGMNPRATTQFSGFNFGCGLPRIACKLISAVSSGSDSRLVRSIVRGSSTSSLASKSFKGLCGCRPLQELSPSPFLQDLDLDHFPSFKAAISSFIVSNTSNFAAMAANWVAIGSGGLLFSLFWVCTMFRFSAKEPNDRY